MKLLFVDGHQNNRLVGVVLTIASVTVLLAVIAMRPQGLSYYDCVTQLLALQHYLDGRSPSFNHLVRVDPDDLSVDRLEWLAWWPPSTQFIVYPLIMAGCTIGGAIRIIVVAAFVAGCLGWVLWFSCFNLPRFLIICLAVAIPWMRYASSGAFRYSAETLAYSSFPWILLACLGFRERCTDSFWSSLWRACLLGLFLGSAYLLKYSILIPTVGALFYLWVAEIVALQKKGSGVTSLLIMAIVTTGTVTPILVFRHLSNRFGGSDPVNSGAGFGGDWNDLIYAIGNPALAMADAFGPLFHALVNPGYLGRWLHIPSSGHILAVAVAGIPGGLILLGIIFRRTLRGGWHSFELLALSAFVVNLAGLLLLWRFADVDHVPRHIAPASIALLPLIIREGLTWWQSCHTRIIRIVLAGTAVFYLVGPLLYGFCYIGAKIRDIPADYVTGRTGLHLPELARQDCHSVTDHLRKHWTPDTVWIVENPCVSVELPGRSILIFGENTVGRELRTRIQGRRACGFGSSKPVSVLLLIPAAYDHGSGQTLGKAIRESIRGASNWNCIPLAGSDCQLWKAKIRPSSSPNVNDLQNID